jgi:hypothetical protein
MTTAVASNRRNDMIELAATIIVSGLVGGAVCYVLSGIFGFAELRRQQREADRAQPRIKMNSYAGLFTKQGRK